MAVTQISRIQVRRGRKLSPTGIPQLASGEFAWAVDSQELFIGNGSVAEGAPYVGNTKVLTENDNILSLISSYQYKSGDPNITQSVKRSLQNKLDEFVSVLDFGAVGDGLFDNADSFEKAFSDLYQDRGVGNNVYKKVLFVPSGEYLFSRSIRIPSDVILVGESREGTTLIFPNSFGIKFVILNPDNPLEFITDTTLWDGNFPQNIHISNLTILSSGNQNGVDITGSRFVLFENVNFHSNYVRSDINEWIPIISYEIGDRVRYNGMLYQAISSIVAGSEIDITDTMFWSLVNQPAVFWTNLSDSIKVDSLKFKNCNFSSHIVALRCDQSTAPETLVTNLLVDSCTFENLDSAVYVDGVLDQTNNWKIVNSDFKTISRHAVYVNYGKNILIKECSFEDVGINVDGEYVVSAVIFRQSQNNLLVDCTSDRQSDVGITSSDTTPYVPEVYGADKVTFLNRNYAAIREVYSPEPLAIFSSFNDFIEIDYHIKLDMGDVRTGKIKIQIHKNPQENEINLTDEYNYSSPHGRAFGIQVNDMLEITRVDFGRLYVGSTISGTNITPGTKISFVPDPGSESPTYPITQISDNYKVDRLPILSPTSTVPLPISFTRDTATNIVFDAIIVDNADSTELETIILRYKQLNGQPTGSATQNGRSSAGIISFDVSYGTLSV